MTDEKTLTIQRAQFQRVLDAVIDCQMQYRTWFEAAKATERRTDEIHWLVEEILVDELFYDYWIKNLPKVEEFTAAEVRQRTGKVGWLLYIAGEIIRLGPVLERKVAKLRNLANGNGQCAPIEVTDERKKH